MPDGPRPHRLLRRHPSREPRDAPGQEATTIPDGLDWCEVYEDGEYRGYYVGVPESIAEIRRLDEKASDAAAELYEALQKLVGFHLPPARTDNPAEVA